MTDDLMKILFFGLIFSVAIMAIHYLLRSFRGKKANRASKISGEPLSRHESELIDLLSLKYDLEEPTIRKVIQVYKNDPEDKKAAILEICQTLNLKKEVAVDIFLKYKEWIRSSDSVSETPEMPDDDWDKWIRWDR